MDAFDFSGFRAEKRSAMPGQTIFSGIAKTLRIVELCLVLLLLSWILTRLPLALRLSAACLRNPLFVFALSNAIIAALLAQSSRLTAESSPPAPPPSAPVEEKTEHCRDQIADRAETDTCTKKDTGAITDSGSRRVYRRCRSEMLEGDGEGEDGRKRKLRRSETEKVGESKYAHDKLSNEEFRRTIEAFIAKQMRLLREESLAIVVQTSEQTNNITSNH